MFFTEYNFLF